MVALNIKVQYLQHSGFKVETTHNQLIFDYYRGTVQLSEKPGYIFSSHSHPDHFNSVIFEWQKERFPLQYILSSDIMVKESLANSTLMSPYEEAQLGQLHVKTFGSTDLGVSFLVDCEGVRIFHAGDLNWWYWSGEAPAAIAQAEKDFKAEIAKIKGEPIDLAFFPVDPRLEHNSGLGAEYFIQELKPSILIPMHFWNAQQAIQKFAAARQDRSTKVIALTQPGEEICL